MSVKWGFVWSVIGLASGTTIGCDSGEQDVDAERGDTALPATAEAVAASLIQLNTFIADSIQIDVLQGGPGDANLFVGNDPADGTASANLPAGGPGTYIDWNNLGGDLANHRLQDLDAASGKDPTAFPQANECVASAQVLSKMDLTYVASANNHTYAYFAVQRAANNGDAGYYWLFTRKEPHLIAGQSPCSASQQRLLYDISGPDAATGAAGDVLLAGHFHPNGDPLLRVYQATHDANNVTAVNAVDFTSGLWALNANGVSAVAVNTTITAPGAFGAAGVKSLSGSNLGTEVFAEAAVPISIFTGGSACGATFFGSVITRSSGAGGTSPDLKDLAGPAVFNFGSPSVTAELTATCGLDVEFDVTSALGSDGQPLADGSYSCLWTFDDNTTSGDCSGVHAFADPGEHTATVTIDAGDGCGATDDTAPIAVYTPLSVVADVAGTCELSFSYAATVTGGSPAGVAYLWDFSAGATPTSSTSASGTATVVGGGSFTGHVVVTDQRTDLICTAESSDSDAVFAALAASLLAAEVNACLSDAVTYTADVTGGSGNVEFTWYGAGAGCTGSTCTIDPPDDVFCVGPVEIWVVATDALELCGSDQSEVETYEKITTVNISNN